MSYVMRGEYIIKPLAYVFHIRGVQLVDIVKYPLGKYMVKYRSHGTGFINLWSYICGQLI